MNAISKFSFMVVALCALSTTAQQAPSENGGRAGMQMPPEMLERMREHMQKKLQETDANSDGQISRDEFMAQAEARFKKADADGNGQITKEEFGMMRNKMMKHHGKRASMPPAPPAQ
jgi:Ca2+-binding EF-hand superfamily protein